MSRNIGAGDLVNVYDRDGQPFGVGLWNAKAKVPLRVLQHGADPLTEADLDLRLERALKLRRDTLHLDSCHQCLPCRVQRRRRYSWADRGSLRRGAVD